MAVLNLTNAKVKNNHPYTIYFSYTPGTYTDNERYLEYTGADFKCPDMSKEISLKGYNNVLKFLQKYYGYGPFDRNKVMIILEEHCQIRFE